MARKADVVIRRRALCIRQDKNLLYLFTLTGPELLQIADISRVSRNEAGRLIGYQRPEVKRHVRNIVEYLDSENVLFPNSLILALPSSTSFKQVRGPRVDAGQANAGTIEIRIPRKGPKPAWIVDGQQRALALSKSHRKNLAVPINAFIADDVELQRDQFLRVNSTKPLPRGLITELLPEVSTILPANLAARKAPSAICDILNRDPKSPFRGLIHRSSTPKGSKGSKPVVSDTSLVKMVQESLSSPNGCLFVHRNLGTNETDFEAIRVLLITYWTAVKKTFPEAWGLPPTKSRLMHSVGLRSMGRLMDRIMVTIDPTAPHAVEKISKELARVRPICNWTEGKWDILGGLRWDEIQNVPSHIRMLSSALVRAHFAGRRDAA